MKRPLRGLLFDDLDVSGPSEPSPVATPSRELTQIEYVALEFLLSYNVGTPGSQYYTSTRNWKDDIAELHAELVNHGIDVDRLISLVKRYDHENLSAAQLMARYPEITSGVRQPVVESPIAAPIVAPVEPVPVHWFHPVQPSGEIARTACGLMDFGVGISATHVANVTCPQCLDAAIRHHNETYAGTRRRSSELTVGVVHLQTTTEAPDCGLQRQRSDIAVDVSQIRMVTCEACRSVMAARAAGEVIHYTAGVEAHHPILCRAGGELIYTLNRAVVTCDGCLARLREADREAAIPEHHFSGDNLYTACGQSTNRSDIRFSGIFNAHITCQACRQILEDQNEPESDSAVDIHLVSALYPDGLCGDTVGETTTIRSEVTCHSCQMLLDDAEESDRTVRYIHFDDGSEVICSRGDPENSSLTITEVTCPECRDLYLDLNLSPDEVMHFDDHGSGTPLCGFGGDCTDDIHDVSCPECLRTMEYWGAEETRESSDTSS